MNSYHITNGSVYCAPNHIKNMKDYKEWVREAYGNLRGVKFVKADNRMDAIVKALRTTHDEKLPSKKLGDSSSEPHPVLTVGSC